MAAPGELVLDAALVRALDTGPDAFDAAAWLEAAWAGRPLTRAEVDRTQWALQQLDAQLAQRFEARARQLAAAAGPRQASLRAALAGDGHSPPLDAVVGRLAALQGRLEGSPLARLCGLAQRRHALREAVALARLEASWRREEALMRDAMDAADFDLAHAQLGRLEALAADIAAPGDTVLGHRGRLEHARAALVARLRQL